MKSLNFGASVAPRTLQAASHNHVSRAPISRCSSDCSNGSLPDCFVLVAILVCSSSPEETHYHRWRTTSTECRLRKAPTDSRRSNAIENVVAVILHSCRIGSEALRQIQFLPFHPQ